jgi:cysteinyl-tRNA synthetase
MSKSLKNFITIEVSACAQDKLGELISQDALKDYSARQLRMAFMLQTWNAKMDFKKDLIADVKTKEDTLNVSLWRNAFLRADVE